MRKARWQLNYQIGYYNSNGSRNLLRESKALWPCSTWLAHHIRAPLPGLNEVSAAGRNSIAKPSSAIKASSPAESSSASIGENTAPRPSLASRGGPPVTKCNLFRHVKASACKHRRLSTSRPWPTLRQSSSQRHMRHNVFFVNVTWY